MILQELQFYQNWTMDEQRAALKTFLREWTYERILNGTTFLWCLPFSKTCLLALYQKMAAPIDQLLYKEVKLSTSIPILWECVHKTFGVSRLNLFIFLRFLSLSSWPIDTSRRSIQLSV